VLLHPKFADRGPEEGFEEVSRTSLPIGPDKTLGGEKGHFQEIRASLFQAHRYMSLFGGLKEIKKASGRYPVD
jgi:hypothetical protein